jgi:hypothetical protein
MWLLIVMAAHITMLLVSFDGRPYGYKRMHGQMARDWPSGHTSISVHGWFFYRRPRPQKTALEALQTPTPLRCIRPPYYIRESYRPASQKTLFRKALLNTLQESRIKSGGPEGRQRGPSLSRES